MIDIWRRHATDKHRMLEAEAQSLARLMNGATAQNLVRVFFLQEQLKSLGKDKSYQPKYVHVIGAGTIGGNITAHGAPSVAFMSPCRTSLRNALHRQCRGPMPCSPAN
jgi:hypothetical protein